MSNLQSSVFSGPSSTSSTNTSNSPPVTLNEDPTFADLVTEHVDSGHTVTLKETLLKNDDVSQDGDIKQITISVKAELRDVHTLLDSYEDNYFHQTIYNTQSLEDNFNGLEMSLTRVGTSSGDVCIQMRGLNTDVEETLSTLCGEVGTRDMNEENFWSDAGCFKLSVLISREMLFLLNDLPSKVLGSLTINVNTDPYVLLPGYILEVSSKKDYNCIALFVTSLFAKPDSILSPDQVNVFNILRFNTPIFSSVPDNDYYTASSFIFEEDSHQYLNPSIQQLLKRTKHVREEKETCSVLQLTKKEVTYLIGRNGATISMIRQQTRANVKVVPINTLNSEHIAVKYKGDADVIQFVRVSGGVNEVQEAVKLIEREVYLYRMEKLGK